MISEISASGQCSRLILPDDSLPYIIIDSIRRTLITRGYSCSVIVKRVDWFGWYQYPGHDSPDDTYVIEVRLPHSCSQKPDEPDEEIIPGKWRKNKGTHQAAYQVECTSDRAMISITYRLISIPYDLAVAGFPDNLLADLERLMTKHVPRWRKLWCRIFHTHYRIYSIISESYEELPYCARCKLFHSYLPD